VNKPIKVGWISCVGEKGGAESLMLECIRALDRTAFEAHVIQLRPGPLAALTREAGGVPHVLGQHRVRELHKVWAAVGAICRIARQEGLQLFHSNGFRAHLYGGLAAWRTKIPEVWTTFTFEAPTLGNQAILKIPTRKVLAICPRTADFFQAAGLTTTMIWPGVNVADLEARAARAPRQLLADKYRIPAGRPWLVSGARLQRYKGQLDFLEALAASPRAAGTHGVIIGGSLFGAESDYARELKARAHTLGIADRVTFTGFVSDDELAGFLAAALVVVHPAYHEDFGLTVAEAQVLGIPVLTYAEVGPAAIIRRSETGWLAPIGDVGRLTMLLDDILAHPERLPSVGARGRRRVMAEFGAEEHARLTMEEYRRVLPPRSG